MAKTLTLPVNTISIRKVGLSEHGMLDRNPRTVSESLENSGDPIYSTDLEVVVNTTALYDAEIGAYANPLIDLSADTPLSVLVIYSKNLGETFDPEDPTALLVSDDTFYEMRKLTHPVRSVTGNLLTEIVQNPEKMRKKESQINIQYSFRFTRNFEGFFSPEEPQNIKIIVVPFLFPKLNDSTPATAMRDTTRYATPLSMNVIRKGQLVESDLVNNPICDLRKDFYQILFNFDVLNANYPKKAVSSDLFASYGKKLQIKGAFAIDRPTLLKNESQFGNFLYNKGVSSEANDKIIELSVINNLKITRQKIKDSRGFDNEPVKISKNYIPKLVVATTERNGSLKIAKRYEGTKGKSKILAEIGELRLTNNSMVVFNDYDTSYRGKYVYSLDMNMTDGVRLYLGSLLASLEDSHSILTQYYGEKYLLGSDPKNTAQIGTEIESVANVIKILNDSAYTMGENFNANLINLTKYKQSFSNLISFIDTLVAKLSRMLNKRQYNLSKSTNSSKTLSNRSIIAYNTTFSEYVDFSAFANLDYDYIGIPSQANLGIALMGEKDLKERFDLEFDKLILDTPDNFAELSSQIFNDTEERDPRSSLEKSYFDLSNNFYSFLSPIQLADTKLTKENMFNNKIFNDFHVREPSNMVLSSKMALSYLMQSSGIVLGGVSFNDTTKKSSASEKETYSDMSEYFSSEDKAVTTKSISPSPDLQDFDGPTDTREKYASFVNAVLKREEGWDLDQQSFGTVSLTRGYGEDLPNHIRVLFGSKSDACRNKWLNMENDYFSNPDTYYMIKQNYMNLVRVQTVGFTNDDLKQPIYRDLSQSDVDRGQPLMCRMILENNQKFQIGTGFGERNYTNKYFIMIPAGDDE
jgi:hypothetical protein